MISWSGWWSQVDAPHNGLEHRLKVCHCVDDGVDDDDDDDDDEGEVDNDDDYDVDNGDDDDDNDRDGSQPFFRNCRWNLDYEVSHDRPILWLFSILRCDGPFLSDSSGLPKNMVQQICLNPKIIINAQANHFLILII